MTTDLAVHSPVEAEISGFEMKPRSLEEAMKFCELMAASDLVPNSYKGKPGNIAVAIQMGTELGLTPMRALRCIAVINGRASMWGDELLAMVLASPVCEYVDESESTDSKGVCKTKRRGCKEQVSIFTLEDAKRAGLLGKAGAWQTNTPRMLKLRARGFGVRDTFADVLAGLVTVEEALDIPLDKANALPETMTPPTLKEKLKAQVEQTENKPADGAGQVTSSTVKTTVEKMQEDIATGKASYSEDHAYLPLPIHDACDRLNIAQSVREISEVMNASLNANYTSEERQVLTKTKDAAMKRLGKK